MKKNDEKKYLWVQKSTETVYENPWISVHHDTVLTPSGTDGIYGVVHFKNHAVGVLPIDDKGNTWLVKQTRYVFSQSSWEIPEGGCPQGESTFEAAKRELKEETGLSAERWSEWLSMDLSNSVTDEQATIYLARELEEGDPCFDETEDIEVCCLPLNDAVNMVLNGDITDAMSVAALLKVSMDDELKKYLKK